MRAWKTQTLINMIMQGQQAILRGQKKAAPEGPQCGGSRLLMRI
jgi:hypothetical protein